MSSRNIQPLNNNVEKQKSHNVYLWRQKIETELFIN